uniref:Uncharacterized protein LOC111134714 n=1 Tax=Crassostrea virginica TaxID=6565 RepID=A0A8B8EJV3_CRAVI|nr:uncharacterized protein LOC111134714 [Crassostrea virginica]
MDCVMLSLRSKSVSFFFNQNEHICRWDCVFLASRSCTTYCTEPWSYYAIKWKKNEALSRPATSSSVYGGDTMKWGPVYATNGARSPTSTNIFHSQPETSPWLKVHLIRSEMITFVRVYNRRDQGEERFHDVAVEVSPDESSSFVQRGFYKGPGLTDQVIEILCDYPTSGQYVRIRIIDGTSNFLNIAEIEIYSV